MVLHGEIVQACVVGLARQGQREGEVPTRPLPVIIDEQCRGFQAAVELAGRRWSAAILLALARGAGRFGDVLRRVDGLSDRLLSQRLKELEGEGLITRTVVPTTPVQIRYGLTERGRDLIVALQAVVEWGNAAKRLITAPPKPYLPADPPGSDEGFYGAMKPERDILRPIHGAASAITTSRLFGSRVSREAGHVQ